MAFKFRLCCSLVTILVAICMIVLGVVLISFFEQMVHDKIIGNVVLKNGTESFETWKDPPVPVYMQFWVFDIQNKEAVIKNGSKPVVREKGPYTYREIRPKHGVVFNENGTLSYVQNKTYVFERSLSVADENDTVTTVNLLYATVVEKFSSSSSFTKWLVNEALSSTGEGLFTTYTVHDLVWGYTNEALKFLADLIHRFSPDTKIAYDIGLFADINGTNDGTYTIYTGADSPARLNILDKWKGLRDLPYWGTPYCNEINGTDGTAYHPFVDKDETLFIYSSDICRSIYVKFLEDVRIRGIDLYRFSPPSEVFANVSTNPDNIGYCLPDCLEAGVLNISVCKEGAPVVMSQPHFYQASPTYQNAIVGLHPDPEQHRTIIDVEPRTGLVLNAEKRLQVNIYVRNVPGLKDTTKLPSLTIFPLTWVNESASMDEASANKFKSQVLTPILITHIVQYGLMALGGFLLLVILVVNARALIVSKRHSRPLLLNVTNGKEHNGDVQYDPVSMVE